MFYYKTGIVRRVRIHPKYVGGGQNIKSIVKKKAMQDLKGSFTPEEGYCITPVCVTGMGDGYCLPLVGFVEFAVTLEALLVYPVVGEVIYAEVIAVTDTCVIFEYACMYGVVREYSLDCRDQYEYQQIEVPEGLIVKRQGIFRSLTDPEKEIKRGTVVRVRITCRTLGGTGFFLIGSMSGEYLGPVKNPPPIPALPVSNPSVENETQALQNLATEGALPHAELQKVWKQHPYNPNVPLSPPLPPISMDK